MWELALLFLRLGATAFGGPAAHIAMMEVEVVQKRAWLTREQFLDLYGATNLIPGPNSTEMAIHIGYLRAGWAGLIVAGACFILPATLIVSAIAWAYKSYGWLPAAARVLFGMRPVIIAIVAHALYKLARTAVKDLFLGVVAVLATALALTGANELVLLGGIALAVAFARSVKRAPISLWLAPAPLVAASTAAAPFGLLPLFLFFLKIGSILFGSGYVLIAFLRSDLVERWHWLTESQLLDAVTVGQVTPGPVFTTATFVGWLLAGPTGASLATLGIFLPAFVFVAISGPLVPRLRRSPTAGAFLDGLNVASLALMAAVTLELGRSAIFAQPGVLPPAIALVSLLALVLLPRLNSIWLVLAGALLGALCAKP